ncbi:tRNA (mnm(5)s(2)U34)-methyltransferase [Peptoniphilus indolicus]|nr:class I SAM-dependent methyltransferase [Peptoniphilus indolicus]
MSKRVDEMLVNSKFSDVVDDILKEINLDGKFALDATCGRGNDSLKLIQNLGSNGFLYACDIQEEAINSTENLLCSKGYQNYRLYKISHEYVFERIEEKLDFIIYNLGYLPKSDKSIFTKAESTIISLREAINKISKEGIIVVVSYLGHQGSTEEREKLSKFLKNLDQKKYKVEKIEFFNQVNNPPIVYKIGVI